MQIISFQTLINGKITHSVGYLTTPNKFKFYCQDLILKLFILNIIDQTFLMKKHILILNIQL
jgi:hypothetical protein